MRKFYYSERDRHEKLISSSSIFKGDNGSGKFKGKVYSFVLRNGKNNLYEPIKDEACQYFKENSISWWGGHCPTGHVLSSQIACINHLMPIRKDHNSVLDLINNAQSTIKFKEVLPVLCDKEPYFIAFEVVSNNQDLKEGKPTRGSNCTSIDALIFAKDFENKNWIIPIEWKYTESYNNQDKSNEDCKGKEKGSNDKGKVRMSRYNDLIKKSAQLKQLDKYAGSVYYQEPFYQLMRQTLWAEQMVANKAYENIKADNFLHLHIVPNKNIDLLNKIYKKSGKQMEETWRDMIKDQSKYVLIDPKIFMTPIKESYPELWQYLEQRYFPQ